MVDRFYSVVLGEHQASDVTEGAATSGEAIELRVEFDVSGGLTKKQCLNGIDAIKRKIREGIWQPA